MIIAGGSIRLSLWGDEMVKADPNSKRQERIELLVRAFREIGDLDTIDPLLRRARWLFPFVRDATLRSYATAALRILNSEEAEKK